MSTRPTAKVPYTALVGRLVQHHREQASLSQHDVASALGIMQPAYSRIENGGTSMTIAQLRVIARTLGLQPGRILNEAERWTQQLQTQGVAVTDEKEVPQAALLIGLGILAAALLAASGS